VRVDCVRLRRKWHEIILQRGRDRRRRDEKRPQVWRGAWSSNRKNAVFFSLLVSPSARSGDFRDEITLLRVTLRRGNGRFTSHSCTQARQATLWVTIGSAGAERFSRRRERWWRQICSSSTRKTRSPSSRARDLLINRVYANSSHVRFFGARKILWSRASCATKRRLESRRHSISSLSFFLSANREKYESRCPRGCFLEQRVLDLSRTQRRYCPIHLASSETGCARSANIGDQFSGDFPHFNSSLIVSLIILR